MKIYTDGATSNNGKQGARGGWAFVVVDGLRVLHKSAGFIDNVTNNICELWAIIRACEYAMANNYQEVTIYSDSAYCINCYTQGWYKKWEANGWRTANKTPVANKELWMMLIHYFKDSRFKFEKVSGHAGDRFNEMADELAVQARTVH